MQATEDRPLDHAAPYRDFLEAAALADRLRFHSVWTSEHHFVEDGYCPALLVALAAASAATTRVRLGTGALALTLHDPDVVERQAAELRRLAGDRVEVGVAVGYRREEFAALRVEWRKRNERFGWMLDRLQDRLGRPAWAVAATTGGARRAARHGSHLLLSPALTDDRAAEVIRQYRDAGGSGSVALIRDAWIHDETAPPPRAVAEHVERLYGMQYAMWGLLRDQWGTVTPADRDRLRSFVGEMARTAVLGPLPVVRNRFRRLGAAGVDVLVVRVQWGWHSRQHVLAQIHRLAELVGDRGGSAPTEPTGERVFR
jgi:alkanesulfonate monooxygenase SsuD/methylene tetrahydromethanopterin reductase-like flavin-dependent oxidoreductase (luciferase family)